MGQESLTEPANLVYHMCAEARWRERSTSCYAAASLAGEGFIHLSPDPETLLHVANTFYAAEAGLWVILVVDASRLKSPLRWDLVGDRTFPHLYGTLNEDAVIRVVPFPRSADGGFLASPEL